MLLHIRNLWWVFTLSIEQVLKLFKTIYSDDIDTEYIISKATKSKLTDPI